MDLEERFAPTDDEAEEVDGRDRRAAPRSWPAALGECIRARSSAPAPAPPAAARAASQTARRPPRRTFLGAAASPRERVGDLVLVPRRLQARRVREAASASSSRPACRRAASARSLSRTNRSSRHLMSSTTPRNLDFPGLGVGFRG